MINVKLMLQLSETIALDSSKIIISINDEELCQLSAAQNSFNAVVSVEKKFNIKIRRLYLKKEAPKENFFEKILNSIGLLIETAGTFASPLVPVYECEERIMLEAFGENPEIRINCFKNADGGWPVFNVQTRFSRVLESTKIIKVSKKELADIVHQRNSNLRTCLMLPVIIFAVILIISIFSWNKGAAAFCLTILIVAVAGMLLNNIFLRKRYKKMIKEEPKIWKS